MAKIAGQLLWRRRQIALGPGVTDVDTGICQVSQALGNDPPMSGTIPTLLDPDGTASRIQVIPMSPLPLWQAVTHSEPAVVNGTVHVLFTNSGPPTTINVLFWDPHTHIGPGDADTYNPANPQ